MAGGDRHQSNKEGQATLPPFDPGRFEVTTERVSRTRTQFAAGYGGVPLYVDAFCASSGERRKKFAKAVARAAAETCQVLIPADAVEHALTAKALADAEAAKEGGG